MAERNEFLTSVSNFFGADLLFILFLTAVFIAFIFALIFSVFIAGYGVKKRGWYFAFLLGVSAVAFSVLNYADSLFILGTGAVFSVPLLTIRRKTTVSKEQKSFIDYVDGEIEKELLEEPKIKPTRERKAKDLDFGHVKSVIKRLTAMELSATDRREVRELESAIYQAEKGGMHQELKEKINDGLGLLLKLMAKYGA